MILTSTTQSLPFTPAWLEDAATPPVFHIRAGSVIERGQMEAELAGQHRAGRIMGYELLQAIRSGVAAMLVGDPELDRVQGLIEAEASGETDAFDDVDRELLVETRKVLAEHWPAYRDLLAQLERRNQIAPILALQRFCVGWDNVVDGKGKPVDSARTRDGVSDAALARVEPLELLVAGNRAYAMQYGGGQEGNSQRPSSSDDGQQTSRSDDTSMADGKSATENGQKTPD